MLPGRIYQSASLDDAIAPRLVLFVRVISAVLRSGFVREDLVVGHVVEVQIVSRWAANDWWVDAEIADQGGHRDVHYIVAKTAAIRPAAWNNAIAKARLNLADQSVAAEDAQAGEARVIGIALPVESRCRPAGSALSTNQL